MSRTSNQTQRNDLVDLLLVTPSMLLERQIESLHAGWNSGGEGCSTSPAGESGCQSNILTRLPIARLNWSSLTTTVRGSDVQ